MAPPLSLVAFVDVDGTAVRINPQQVTAIQSVPSDLLPTGIVAGTYVDVGGPNPTRFAVQGTIAATAAALSASGLDIIVAIIKSSDGSILSQNAAAVAAGLGVTHNGVGDNTVTLVTANASVLAELGVALTALDKESVTLGNSTVTSFNVLGWDAAGAADDINFMIVLIPTG